MSISRKLAALKLPFYNYLRLGEVQSDQKNYLHYLCISFSSSPSYLQNPFLFESTNAYLAAASRHHCKMPSRNKKEKELLRRKLLLDGFQCHPSIAFRRKKKHFFRRKARIFPPPPPPLALKNPEHDGGGAAPVFIDTIIYLTEKKRYKEFMWHEFLMFLLPFYVPSTGTR